MVFLLYELDDIAEITIQHGADFRQDFCADMLVLAQLGEGGSGHACGQTQILLFHVFIDQELPQLVITNRHCNTSFLEYVLIQVHSNTEARFRLLKIQFSDWNFYFQRRNFKLNWHTKGRGSDANAPTAILRYVIIPARNAKGTKWDEKGVQLNPAAERPVR